MPETTASIDLRSIQAVRKRTLDVLDRLTATAVELDLPKPPDAFEMCRDKLRENRYMVLVAGEAKRGKSTFVNAILGREVLPTDVDIATCQVFRVRQAPDEGYRLRFEDDTATEITEDAIRDRIGLALKALTPTLAKQLAVDPSARGVVVDSIVPGSPAAKAGLHSGDVIPGFNGNPVTFGLSLAAVNIGETFGLRYFRVGDKEPKTTRLPGLGSQLLANTEESPQLGQMIRWIEVDAPVHFLPREITLLDTPGLGSLYAAHSRITRRFVPMADAVILVLHSDSPIGTEEIQFLEEILGVTRSVLFIQTMIDRYTREHWQAIQARNEQILIEKFGDRLADGRVWPISSTNLLEAAKTGDADFELVSRIRPLATALQAFLFRVAGWSRCADALLLALNHHRSVADLLEFRRSSLREETGSEQAARRSGLAARKHEFEESWGPQGQRRRQLLDDVRGIVQRGKQEFQQIIGFNGAIYDCYSRRVSDLKNLDQARVLAEYLAQDVVDESTRAWEDLRSRTQERITAKLAPFLKDTDVNIAVPRTETSEQLPDPLGNPDVRSDPYGKFQTALREWRLAFGAVATGASVTALLVPSIVATTFFLPIAVLEAFGAGLAGMLRGINLASNREIDEAKRELENHLRAVVKRVQQHYYNVSLDVESDSIVEDYFNKLTSSITDYVAKVAGEMSREAQAELDRLVEEAKLNKQERTEKAAHLSRQISAWAEIGTELIDISKRLDRLEREQYSRLEREQYSEEVSAGMK
jgi:GTPase SAR1 family protein